MTHDHSASRRRFSVSANTLANGAAASPALAQGMAQSPVAAGKPPYPIGHSTDTSISRGTVPRVVICGGGWADVDPRYPRDRKPETAGEDFNRARPSREDMFA